MLPFQQFQALLTLFSKFFSSFAHATCSLSVSCPYLALDEIYHLLRAVLPNNPTLESYNTMTPLSSLQDYHLLWWCLHNTLGKIGNQFMYDSKATFQVAELLDSACAIAASLAVTKAILVSFFSSAY